jgi:hypothetical protein
MSIKLFGAAVTGGDALDGVVAVPKTKDSSGIQNAINSLIKNNGINGILTNGTWSSGVISFTINEGHTLVERYPIFIDECPNSNYNGFYLPLNVGTTSFQVFKENDPGLYGSGNGHTYNEGGGLVFLSPGGYIIDKKITLYSNITLMGAGSGSTILYAEGLNDDAIVIDPAQWDSSTAFWQIRHNINAQDFGLVGNSGNINHRGIGFDGVIEGNITNVQIQYFRTGINFRGWGGTILNSKTVNCYTGYDLSWPDPDHTMGATNGVTLISSRYEASPMYPPYELSFESASYDGTRISVTTASNHKLQFGAEITLYNCDNTTFNGEYDKVRFDSSVQFSAVPIDGTPSGTASDGTVKGRLIAVMMIGSLNSSYACVLENVHSYVPLVSGTWVDGTMTFVTSSPHYVTTADPVTIVGCSPSSYDGNYTYATKIDATTFTILNDGSAVETPTGFIYTDNRSTCFYIGQLDVTGNVVYNSPTFISGLYSEGMEKIAILDGVKGVTFSGCLVPRINEGLNPLTLRNGSDGTDAGITIIGQSNGWSKIVNSFNSNFGIGTLNDPPLEKLDVRGNASISGSRWTTNGDTAKIYLGIGSSHYISATYGDGVHIGTFQVPDAVTVKETTGYLGIDQTSPQQMMDVNGGIRIGDTTVALDGSLRFNSGKLQVYQNSQWRDVSTS